LRDVDRGRHADAVPELARVPRAGGRRRADLGGDRVAPGGRPAGAAAAVANWCEEQDQGPAGAAARTWPGRPGHAVRREPGRVLRPGALAGPPAVRDDARFDAGAVVELRRPVRAAPESAAVRGVAEVARAQASVPGGA